MKSSGQKLKVKQLGSKKPIRYLSFFSGIGAFEFSAPKHAECVGYSEIKTTAIKVYSHHHPKHVNLGDITKITKKQLRSVGRVDLILGGSPCTNLSSISRTRKGNTGISKTNSSQSHLLYELLRVFKIVKSMHKNVKIVIENNASMSKNFRDVFHGEIAKQIPDILDPVCINAECFVPQKRRRLFWANFKIEEPTCRRRKIHLDFLDPKKDVEKLGTNRLKNLNADNRTYKKINNTWRIGLGSKHKDSVQTYKFIPTRSRYMPRFISYGDLNDTYSKQCTGFTPRKSGLSIGAIVGSANYIIDRRFGKKDEFIIRPLTVKEMERFMGYPIGYVYEVLKNMSQSQNVLGNSIVTHAATHVWKNYLKNVYKSS